MQGVAETFDTVICHNITLQCLSKQISNGLACLQIPWASLGKSAVVVIMDRLYVLAGPKDDTAAPGTEDEEV